jgi:hypothetical protein
MIEKPCPLCSGEVARDSPAANALSWSIASLKPGMEQSEFWAVSGVTDSYGRSSQASGIVEPAIDGFLGDLGHRASATIVAGMDQHMPPGAHASTRGISSADGVYVGEEEVAPGEEERTWGWMTDPDNPDGPPVLVGRPQGGQPQDGNYCCPESLAVNIKPEVNLVECNWRMDIKVEAVFREGRHEGKNCVADCCEVRQFISTSFLKLHTTTSGREQEQPFSMGMLGGGNYGYHAWGPSAATPTTLIRKPDSDAALRVYDLGPEQRAPRPEGAPDEFPQAGQYWVLDQGVKLFEAHTNLYGATWTFPAWFNAYPRNKVVEMFTTFGSETNPGPFDTISKDKRTVTYRDPLETVGCENPMIWPGIEKTEAWDQSMLRVVIRRKPKRQDCKGTEVLEKSTSIESHCSWTAGGKCQTTATPSKPISL